MCDLGDRLVRQVQGWKQPSKEVSKAYTTRVWWDPEANFACLDFNDSSKGKDSRLQRGCGTASVRVPEGEDRS